MSKSPITQKRKASSAETNPQAAQKLKITMHVHAANAAAGDQADQVDPANALDAPASKLPKSKTIARSRMTRQGAKTAQSKNLQHPREFQFVNTFGPSVHNAFHPATAATIPGMIPGMAQVESAAHAPQSAEAQSWPGSVPQDTLDTRMGGSGSDGNSTPPELQQQYTNGIPVQKKVLNDVIDEKVQLTSIVGRVIFKEDKSRTYYYLINFDNGMCAWYYPKQPDLSKPQRKRLGSLIAQFDKAYPKSQRDEEKTEKNEENIEKDDGIERKEGKEEKKTATGGKIKTEDLPKASIRPPPGYPAWSLVWEDKVLVWFGHNGFQEIEEGREKQAQAAAESTQDVDDSIRCYDASLFAEAIKPRRGSRLKAKTNYVVVAEDEMSTEEDRFKAVASNGSLERSDRRAKLVSSPVKGHPSASRSIPSQYQVTSAVGSTMASILGSDTSKTDVKMARSGRRVVPQRAMSARHTRFGSVAEEPDASKTTAMVSDRGEAVASEGQPARNPQSNTGEGKSAATATKATSKPITSTLPNKDRDSFLRYLNQVGHLQSKQTEPAAQVMTESRFEVPSTNDPSVMLKTVVPIEVSSLGMLPSKHKLALKQNQTITADQESNTGPSITPLRAGVIMDEELQDESRDIARSSADVTCVGDPAKDVNDPRQKSAPKIIMRCTRSSLNIPSTGWRNATERKTTNVFPATMEFHPGGPDVKWENFSLREVGPVLYLVGWAENNTSGIRKDHRQFVQHGDIIRMVGRDEVDRFEKRKTPRQRNDSAFKGARNPDARDEEQRQHCDPWDAGFATDERLRLMGFGDEISATVSNKNVIQVHGRRENNFDKPKAVMSSAEVAFFWGLHEQREQARKRVQAVDREIKMATELLMAGHQLPTSKRHDQSTSLELLDYMDINSDDKELKRRNEADRLNARDSPQGGSTSNTRQERLEQGDLNNEFLDHQRSHPRQQESSLWENVDGLYKGTIEEADSQSSVSVPLAVAESDLNVANGRRTHSKRKLDEMVEEPSRPRLTMSSKRTFADCKSDAGDDSDGDVIPFRKEEPEKKRRRSPENEPPAHAIIRPQADGRPQTTQYPYIMVKAIAQHRDSSAGHEERAKMADVHVEIARESQLTSGFPRVRQASGVGDAVRSGANYVVINDDDEEEEL